jgi:enoyl-CoA hydratase/carnithine racemase
MGACSILPRIIGQGRAAELLYTGRDMCADEGLDWGFYNRVVDDVQAAAAALAMSLASGPSIAHAITKRQLECEWNVSLDEALEMEARAQAHCMQTRDFHRAYEAFSNRQKPVFEGN